MNDIHDLSLDDLDEKYRWLAELIGMDKLILLCEHTGGTWQYIPQMDSLLKNRKYKDIINEFNGYNIKQLARKYSVSESTVWRLVQPQIEQRKKSPLDGQVTLFEEFQ